MKIVIFVLIFMCVIGLSSRAQGLRFETGSWAEVLEKAKVENKLVFVDVYTKWCGPCKIVAKDVFPQKEMGDYYNSRFVNFSIDAESPAGKEFVEKYPVSGYPTFLYLNTSGEIVYKFMGGGDTERFIKEAKFVPVYAQHGGYERMMNAIKQGTRDTILLFDYYLSASSKDQPKAFNNYLKAFPDESLLLQKNDLLWDMSEYDEELMNRIVDKMVSLSNDPQFTRRKELKNTESSVRTCISKKLTKSIQEANLTFFKELLELKNKLNNYKGGFLKEDLKLIPPEFGGASSEYIQLCYWAKNRIEEQEFKRSLVSYMDQLMKNHPVDSLWDEYHSHALMREKEFVKQGGGSMYFSDVLKYMNFSAKNMIVWVDCFWRVSPSDAATKSLCKKWVDYIYRANVYNPEVVILSADLLNNIGYSKEAITLLEKGIANLKEIVKEDNSFRTMELMCQDLKNKKF